MRVSSPSKLDATIVLPSSKSISNRALVIGALCGNTAQIDNVAECDDSRVVVKALDMLSRCDADSTVIDIMAAGTAMRFLTAFLAATQSGHHIITGSERMRHRPISVLVDALRSLGASIGYVQEEGFPPLEIAGHSLEGGKLLLPGNVSSQYVSALLMIGPVTQNGLDLVLEGEVMSRPYIDMTLGIMKTFGAKAEWTSNTSLHVQGGGYAPVPYCIEGDWSAASYWYEIVALWQGKEEAHVVLPSLLAQSLQGDSSIANIFAKLGVKTEYNNDSVVLRGGGPVVERMDIDMREIPDMAQTLVVTLCLLGVPFHITGLSTLKIKETDRIVALQKELAKLGFTIESRYDSELLWDGQRTEPSGQAIDTYDDHRMAMAFAPAAIVMGSIDINNPEVVTKSYPKFWDDLKAVGFSIA